MIDARRYSFDDIEVGQKAVHSYRIGPAEMETFANLSGDRSRIHHDADFARANGFEGVVVYGALTVANLSYVVGMLLPGYHGLATSWRVDFNGPLYVNEDARIEAEVQHKSLATGTIKLRFKVFAGERVVATGSAEAKLLAGQ